MNANDFPLALYLGADVRKIDQLAIEKQGVSGYQLMCRAGLASFNILQEHWPHAKQIEVFCGPGNNGGDGFVLARLAKDQGCNVKLYAVGEGAENRLSQEAKQARQDWLDKGGEIIRFEDQALIGDVIVDALLGTGVRTGLGTEFQHAIAAINQSKSPVLAIDLPSGLNADTGNFEQAVYASVTITFIAIKLGTVCGQSADVVGKLIFDNLGISASAFSQIKPCAWRIDYQEMMSALPLRCPTSYKGDNGHVCIIGSGQSGYSGAVCLAGEAALRAGAGLVSTISCPESLPLLARAPAELMCYTPKHPKEMHPLLARATFVVLGPGLSTSKWGEKCFHEALKTTKPCLVDADGLNWLARCPQKRTNWILTPHPGEAARLLGKTTQQIQQDRMQSAILLHEKYGGVVVLKGAGTFVVATNGEIAVNVGGFPALGTGGTGDVLSGFIAGLVAQGLSLSQAACLGVSVHATAASLEATLGPRGMIASDLFLHMRNLLNPDGQV